MKKFLFIFFLFLCSSMLVSKQLYACGSKHIVSKTAACSANQVSDSKDQPCCDAHGSGNNTERDCDGSCNKPICHYQSPPAPLLLAASPIRHTLFTTPKGTPGLPSFILSPGFHTIWIPPKIG